MVFLTNILMIVPITLMEIKAYQISQNQIQAEKGHTMKIVIP